MAHFAELQDNIVSRVIVIHNDILLDANLEEVEQLGKDFCINHYGGDWIQTSYNGRIRGKYAGIGDTYNKEEDIFIAPQPFPSWTRSGSYWQPPVPYPQDDNVYQWNESEQRWDAL